MTRYTININGNLHHLTDNQTDHHAAIERLQHNGHTNYTTEVN